MIRSVLFVCAFVLSLSVSAQDSVPVSPSKRVMDDVTAAPSVDVPVALGGFDIMTYYRGDGPKKGSAEHVAVHEGVTYYFIDARNRKAFLANPDLFQPEFGHTCAFALGEGEITPTDPTLFLVEDNKLLLFSTPVARQGWVENPSLRRQKAEAEWRERGNTISDIQIPIGG